jgi:hypothetical protein
MSECAEAILFSSLPSKAPGLGERLKAMKLHKKSLRG